MTVIFEGALIVLSMAASPPIIACSFGRPKMMPACMMLIAMESPLLSLRTSEALRDWGLILSVEVRRIVAPS